MRKILNCTITPKPRRQRREGRGAEVAEKGGAWGGGVPLGDGSGKGAMPLPQKIFRF